MDRKNIATRYQQPTENLSILQHWRKDPKFNRFIDW